MLFELEQRQVEGQHDAIILRMRSTDGTNRLTRRSVVGLRQAITGIAEDQPSALIITGNEHFFSAGADLSQIAALTGPTAYDFALCGQQLMNTVAGLPLPAIAAVRGYCMGGGLDLALACHRRIASPNAVFGHRGAALGLITGWGGTQRLPRLIGKSHALHMFLAAEKIHAQQALEIGLIHQVTADPIEAALDYIESRVASPNR